MGGSLKSQEIIDIKTRDKYKNIKNFVETGTYKADTTILASTHYDNVYTTEIHEPLFVESKLRAQSEGVNNIKFYLGDSLNNLPAIMSELVGGSVFFLDAHISGNDSSWNGFIRVPLVEELNIILKYKLDPSVFIFDDLRLWKTVKAFDWVHITNDYLIQIIQSSGFKIVESYEKDDRFYVYIE